MNGKFVTNKMFFLFIVADMQAEFQRFPATYTMANDIGTDGNADPLGNRHLRALNGVTVEVLSLASPATRLIPGLATRVCCSSTACSSLHAATGIDQVVLPAAGNPQFLAAPIGI